MNYRLFLAMNGIIGGMLSIFEIANIHESFLPIVFSGIIITEFFLPY